MTSSWRNIRAIAGKELRSYYSSPVAWVLLGLFGTLFGTFFAAGLLGFLAASMSQFGGPQRPVNVNNDLISPVLHNAAVIILFIVPMITMRSYAEEKRSGTIELLLTSPLKDVEIVIGKFLAGMGMYVGLLGVSALFMSVLFLTGNPAWKPVLSGYLGLLLLGGGFVALGLVLSSLTNNQMVAGASSFVLFLVLWVTGWFVDSVGPRTGEVLSYLSIIEHFGDFAKGIIDTKHIVYYLSVIAFGLFLTTKSVDTERWRG
jgi:ABC-2 type transport system permease protein